MSVAPLRSKLIAEFVGTFALVFAGTGAIVANQLTAGAVTHVGIALTFGLVIGVMVYAYKDVSGAQYNPAVSIALWATRRQSLSASIVFILVQMTASLVASAVIWVVFSGLASQSANGLDYGATVPNLAAGIGIGQALAIETVATFFLVSVILGVVREQDQSNAWAGLAIGGTVTLSALFAGPITGASMNPARSFGPALFTVGALRTYWIYVVAPIVGAVVATAADFGIRKKAGL